MQSLSIPVFGLEGFFYALDFVWSFAAGYEQRI